MEKPKVTVTIHVWLQLGQFNEILNGESDYRNKVMEAVKAGRFEVVNVDVPVH